MYIAMNRFRVNPERVQEFEQLWLERETHLQGPPNFEGFDVIQTVDNEDKDA